MNKAEIYKSARQSKRKMLAAKIDWHLRLLGLSEAAIQFDVDRHDAAIRDAELRLHQLKRSF